MTWYHAVQIPRATRQLVLQKLAGQHLAMALIDKQQDLTPESVTACEDLRTTALSAAVDQELKLFKSCLSKVVSSSCSSQLGVNMTALPRRWSCLWSSSSSMDGLKRVLACTLASQWLFVATTSCLFRIWQKVQLYCKVHLISVIFSAELFECSSSHRCILDQIPASHCSPSQIRPSIRTADRGLQAA